MINKFIHNIKHLLRKTRGDIEYFYVGNDLYVGFRCLECKEIRHAQKAITRIV